MTYRVIGLSSDPFASLFGLADEELAKLGVRRFVADAKPGFACRVSLEDAEPGETVLLLNYEHQPADTPFRSRHAIFVREGRRPAYSGVGAMPDQLRGRLLSIRAFDAQHMMVDADVADGTQADPIIDHLLADPAVAYLHVHYARRGCYAARIERA